MALIHKRQALNSRGVDWSELPEDVIRLVLRRLRLSDFHRARAVCSTWCRVWGDCVSKPNQVPWLILFPDPAQIRRSCMLYNPQEEENVYTIQDLGVDPCLASCGTWLLIVLYRKGHFASKAEMMGYPSTDKAVVWIDEKTKDYVVACSWGGDKHAAFCKKGDCEWRQIPPLLGCSDIALKDHKLYIYYEDGSIGISDLKFVTKTAHVQLYPFRFRLGSFSPYDTIWTDYLDWKTNIVITISGDFLMVGCVLKRRDLSWLFRGDQAVILDLGITVQASSDIQGITRNSTYFSGLPSSQKDVFVFNLSSQKVQRLSSSSISSRPFSNARWLFPTS
ncbi:putative F-box protein [Arabidopsis thaliana]